MIERPESLYLGWLLIVGGAVILLLRHRLAVHQRDMRDLRRERRPESPQTPQPGIERQRDADPRAERTILAAIGVVLMLGGLMLIAREPIGSLLGLP